MNGMDLHKLSKGWVWAKLEDGIEILDHQRVPINAEEREKRISGKPVSQLYPYYGATGQVGWIDNYLFDEEIVLLGEDGAPFLEYTRNKAYLIKGKSWVNNHAHVLKAINGVTINLFLCYYLNSFNYHGYVTGTTRLKLNQSPMRKIPLPLPPLPEQHRIVSKIEELFTKLDAGVKSLQTTKKLLKRYRQSVLKAAVEGKLTEEWREAHKGELEPASKLLERILEERRENTNGEYKKLPPIDISSLPELPEGWVWVTLPQIGELNRGKSKHRPRDASFLYGGPHPFIQTGDIRQANGVIRRYTQTYSEEGLKQSRLWPKGTLCITIAANIGDTAILGFDACFPDSIVGFISRPSYCNIHFIEFFLRTAKENLERYAPATAQKNINLAILNDLAIPFPSSDEQNEIALEVERRFSITDEVESVIDAEIKRAERLRQSILKQAFSGKLVPQDPSDEPASVLLERIKEEKVIREADGKAKRKSRKTSSKSRTAKRRAIKKGDTMQMELI